MSDSQFESFLTNHPRLLTALLALLVLLTQATAVLANGTGSSGP